MVFALLHACRWKMVSEVQYFTTFVNLFQISEVANIFMSFLV